MFEEGWCCDEIESPVGVVTVVVSAMGVVGLRWGSVESRFKGLQPSVEAEGLMAEVRERLVGYFAGEAVDFSGVPLDLREGTVFQRRVWGVLREIPRGERRSYGWVAEQLGRRGAARAVGQANRVNPVPVIIPCHRVIQGDGGLGGYMGAGEEGLRIKTALLALEQRTILIP